MDTEVIYIYNSRKKSYSTCYLKIEISSFSLHTNICSLLPPTMRVDILSAEA